MQNYTGHGWQGKKYDSKLSTSDINKLLRKELKDEFPEIKFSISKRDRNHITIVVLSAPMEFLNDKEAKYQSVNQYHHRESTNFTPQAKEILGRIIEIVNQYNFDDTDSSIDYFSTNFYWTLTVGNWDKPFQVIRKGE